MTTRKSKSIVLEQPRRKMQNFKNLKELCLVLDLPYEELIKRCFPIEYNNLIIHKIDKIIIIK